MIAALIGANLAVIKDRSVGLGSSGLTLQIQLISDHY
jgi:hypothetical protein